MTGRQFKHTLSVTLSLHHAHCNATAEPSLHPLTSIPFSKPLPQPPTPWAPGHGAQPGPGSPALLVVGVHSYRQFIPTYYGAQGVRGGEWRGLCSFVLASPTCKLQLSLCANLARRGPPLQVSDVLSKHVDFAEPSPSGAGAGAPRTVRTSPVKVKAEPDEGLKGKSWWVVLPGGVVPRSGLRLC